MSTALHPETPGRPADTPPTQDGAAATAAALTVYFDGSCPVCSREIAVYRRQPGAEACAWIDASRCEPQALGPGLDAPRALARMHVRRADGTLVDGAAAFAEMWKALPATRRMGRVAGWAPVTWLLEGAYRLFLKLRPLWRSPATERPAEALSDPSAVSVLPRGLQADLRSDQAGETGAVFIYRGILAVSRDPAVRAFAQHHLATEQEHLRLIDAWQPAYRASRLLPAWRVAGFLTGALPALCGARAVYRTIAAVETFVDRHYQAQIDAIDRLTAATPRSGGSPLASADASADAAGDTALAQLRPLLVRCQGDEVAHRDEAAALAGTQPAGWLMRGWTWMVGAGSAAAVHLARRV